MSIFSFERRGQSNGWNYSDPEKEGFMTTIQGTVVEVKSVPATEFNSNQIKRWPDGNVVLNFALVIQGQSGRELEWVFSPGSAKKPSVAMQACRAALLAAKKPGVDLTELGGLKIQITTVAPPEGFSYGQGNPRPWTVEILGDGDAAFRGATEYKDVQVQDAPAGNVQEPVVEEMSPYDLPF